MAIREAHTRFTNYLSPLLLIFLFLLSFSVSLAQIKSGPMLGYKELKEVVVWVQTDGPQDIYFEYFADNDNRNKTQKLYASSEKNANCLHLVADHLEPGTTYSYRILSLDDQVFTKGQFTTQQHWRYRTDAPDFSFLIGSCTYTNEEQYDRPGKPYGKSMEIFLSMAKTNAEAMLWLGDNIYLREPDWGSMSGIQYRYTHFKSQDSLQEFLKNFHHYAIWDDHDFGPNDGDRSFINKDLTLQAFKDFWANPSYGIEGCESCITGMFSYNDLDFFLLDNRSQRSPNNRKTGKREILGDAQIQWLIDAMAGSKARFKIVAIGGQVLSPAAVHENYATFPEEREKLLKLIADEEIKNVVFLSGDRHKTELTKYESENGIVMYDFTSSPLTSTSYDTHDEGNTLRLEGTHYPKQNFGMLEMKGSYKERKLVLKTFDTKGNLVWERELMPQR